MGIVAAMPHQSGRTKSAIRPSPTKSIQNILRSTVCIVDLRRNIQLSKPQGVGRSEATAECFVPLLLLLYSERHDVLGAADR